MESNSRVVWLLAAILTVLVTAGGTGGYVYWHSHQHKRVNNVNLEQQVQAQLRQQSGDPSIVVICDHSPIAKAGVITDCTASDQTSAYMVRVTMDDNRGHFHWQLASQG